MRAAARIALAIVAMVTIPVSSRAQIGPFAIEIDDTSPAVPSYADHFIGSNTPAWIADRLADPVLHTRAAAAGLGLMRIPGGAWSDMYGWLSCELRADQAGAEPCGQGWASWVARPTDLLNFLRAVGFSGDRVIYTLNVNATKEEAAAVVAFFNALPGDATPIGVDRNGFDWRTAGYWAQLRVDHGNAAPLGIRYWEFGNEVYGSLPGTGGAQCVPWGWENGWTCDGTEYVSGNAAHDGYLAVRAAMRAVDSSILVGAVGFEDPAAYENWGNEVIAAAGAALDFYVIHPYAYYVLPAYDETGFSEILAQPTVHWTTIRTRLNAAFAAHAGGRDIPIAVTEFNIVSSQDQDTRQLLTRAINALFLADSIGQAMQQGFAFFNQWDLTNGCAKNRTCYDLLVDGKKWRRSPQYFAFPLWAAFGNDLLPAASSADTASELGVYAGRIDADTVALLGVNKAAEPADAVITLASGAPVVGGTIDVAAARKLKAKRMKLNGDGNPADDLSDAPPSSLLSVGTTVSHRFPPYSITLLRMNVAP
jgi:hypothetical protein